MAPPGTTCGRAAQAGVRPGPELGPAAAACGPHDGRCRGAWRAVPPSGLTGGPTSPPLPCPRGRTRGAALTALTLWSLVLSFVIWLLE